MPFSAKNEYNRPWVGRGAAIDKKITMKVGFVIFKDNFCV